MRLLGVGISLARSCGLPFEKARSYMSDIEQLSEVRRWLRYAREVLEAAETLFAQQSVVPRHLCIQSLRSCFHDLERYAASFFPPSRRFLITTDWDSFFTLWKWKKSTKSVIRFMSL
jgi:hypothetical protein